MPEKQSVFVVKQPLVSLQIGCLFLTVYTVKLL